jgi:hypothetical protein
VAHQRSFRTLGRGEDSTLMMIIVQALIATYFCVLLILTCGTSPDVCNLFGFFTEPLDGKRILACPTVLRS